VKQSDARVPKHRPLATLDVDLDQVQCGKVSAIYSSVTVITAKRRDHLRCAGYRRSSRPVGPA
jgi:hypothetical protein